MSPLPPTPAALRHKREHTITRLCEHFAHDHLETRELEELIDRAHRAETLAALDNLLAGLPELAPNATPERSSTPAVSVDRNQVVVAIMGGAERKGPWRPAENIHVVALMGGAELDFREARFGPGVTNLYVVAIMGGVEILVPPTLHVESNGLGIMGGFAHIAREQHPASAGPVLRISGIALMGGVEIREKKATEEQR